MSQITKFPGKALRITEFGNPLLRTPCKQLTQEQIISSQTKNLILGMYELVEKKKLGVGLAAPQVGVAYSLAVICIQQTKARTEEVKESRLVIINPVITKVYGRRAQMYEGCISGTKLFAKVPRYKKIQLQYHDQAGERHEQDFEGLEAHVIQHEVDHLNGVLFVDRVKDTATFITEKEYLKLKKEKQKNAKA